MKPLERWEVRRGEVRREDEGVRRGRRAEGRDLANDLM
jgi:hypothetical protein